MTASEANGFNRNNNNDFNINQALMTLMIMNRIDAALSSTASCSDEENCDNTSTSSQSCEEASSEQVAIENEPITINEARLCKICYVVQYETAFSPCGHVVACAACASSVKKCPICRNQFKNVLRLYFS